jgi:hypothetical protein
VVEVVVLAFEIFVDDDTADVVDDADAAPEKVSNVAIGKGFGGGG